MWQVAEWWVVEGGTGGAWWLRMLSGGGVGKKQTSIQDSPDWTRTWPLGVNNYQLWWWRQYAPNNEDRPETIQTSSSSSASIFSFVNIKQLWNFQSDMSWIVGVSQCRLNWTKYLHFEVFFLLHETLFYVTAECNLVKSFWLILYRLFVYRCSTLLHLFCELCSCLLTFHQIVFSIQSLFLLS